MNYWLHRISHEKELSHPLFFDKGFLTIGFSDCTSQDLLEIVANEDWQGFNKEFIEKWGESRTKHNLWRFLESFKKGDIVIVPTWKSFSICRIVDDGPLLINDTFSNDLKNNKGKTIQSNGTHLFCEGEKYDLGFARRIEIIRKNLKRADFADAKLTARMKILQTNSDINDIADSVNRSINSEEPINLHTEILKETEDRVLSCIRNQINPDKFEHLIKAYFKKVGASHAEIPAKNETEKQGDSDILAIFEHIKLIVYVQAKFHQGETSEWAMNQIKDYKQNHESLDEEYSKVAWVITTADSFKEKAIEEAAEEDIQLINGSEFAKMILNAGLDLLLEL